MELTKDEQLVVRQAGIQTISNILTLLDDGELYGHSMSAICLQSMSGTDEMQYDDDVT